MKDILTAPFMTEVRKLLQNMYRLGWDERNGGNLTYRMKQEEVEECRPYFSTERPWVNMGVQADNLKGEYFIATGSGTIISTLWPARSC